MALPGVVAIQALRERAGFIETGAFDVRIILTEEPTGGLTTDLINVVNGSATAIAKGATLKGAHANVPPARMIILSGEDGTAQDSELTTDVVSYTTMDGDVATDAADGSHYPKPRVGTTSIISISQQSHRLLPSAVT